MGVLPKINIVARQFRKCSMAATSSASTATSSDQLTASFVQDHVRQMQTDIIEQLIPQDSSGAIENLADLNVTSNLGRMTHYYFQQGGKMLRPTVALLMGNACNSAANRSILEQSLAMPMSERTADSAHLTVCKNQYKIGMIDDSDSSLHEIAYEYGRNLGIAFQLVDDLLDFVATADEMGKPVAADLKLGETF
uniref:Uncharacterized protein n=1 Tax=Caenorhabditis japonica TaxID=281687 RepID=A0A8R1I185_CAEJA